MESGIYSNEKDLLVKFGGKIGVGLASLKNGEKGYCLILQELDEIHPIKEHEPEKFKEERSKIVLHFKDIGSVEVVEDVLKDIKIKLMKDKDE